MKAGRTIYIFKRGRISVSDRLPLIDILRKLGAKVLDIRVARGHLEVDVNGELGGAALSYIGEGLITKVPASAFASANGDMFSRALCLIKEERFWESHEALEQIWRKSDGPRKDYLHFLILCSAAMVHHQRGRQDVSLGMIRRAASIAPANTYEIDTRPLFNSCGRSVADNDPGRLCDALLRLGRERCRDAGGLSAPSQAMAGHRAEQAG